MPRFILALVLLAASAFAAVDLTKPIPALTLDDGRILKNVTFANFKTDTVLVRHAGGALALRYEFLPEAVRAAVQAKRPGGPLPASSSAAAKPVELKGQVFVATRGAGAYKYAGVAVYAFDLEHISTWEHTNAEVVRLPAPITRTTTDGDGRFTLNVPANRPYFIFAQGTRMITSTHTERAEWRIPQSQIKVPGEVLLTNDRMIPARTVQIESGP